MKKITVSNQKGGVSKTTTVWALGTGLQLRGYKVLLVDLDPQSNLSFTAGVDLLNLNASLYDVFKGNNDINTAITHVENNLDIIVGSIDFASADREFVGAKSLFMLRDCIEDLQSNYDYCIIDTPPTLGILCENAMIASDYVIIPIKTDVYALQGIGQLKNFINEHKKYINSKLEILGILPTCIDTRTNITKLLLEEFNRVADEMNTRVFNSRIRNTISVSENALKQGNIYLEYPNATATQDYKQFVDEFLSLVEV